MTSYNAKLEAFAAQVGAYAAAVDILVARQRAVMDQYKALVDAFTAKYIAQHDPESTSFVTDVEFAQLASKPRFIRDSAIQGHIGNATYICLAPTC